MLMMLKDKLGHVTVFKVYLTKELVITKWKVVKSTPIERG